MDIGAEHAAHHHRARERGDADGRQHGGGIAADHELEGVEGARQRRIEGGGDGGGGAHAHEGAEIAAADPEALPDPGREAGAKLGKSRLHPDRRAEAGRNHGEEGQRAAVGEGHLAAEEGVGLDGVHRLALAGTPHQHRRSPGEEPAPPPAPPSPATTPPQAPRSMLAAGEGKIDLVKQLHDGLDRHHAGAHRHADDGAHHQERHLIVAEIALDQAVESVPDMLDHRPATCPPGPRIPPAAVVPSRDCGGGTDVIGQSFSRMGGGADPAGA